MNSSKILQIQPFSTYDYGRGLPRILHIDDLYVFKKRYHESLTKRTPDVNAENGYWKSLAGLRQVRCHGKQRYKEILPYLHMDI